MGRFLRFLVRLVVITAGFVAACLTAALATVFLNGILTPQEAARLAARGLDASIVLGVIGLAALIANTAFLPAVVLVLIGEAGRRRDWLFYALGGGLVALVCLTAGYALTAGPPHVDVAMMSRAARDVVAAMLGGLGYWLVAGRGAGRWLPGEAPRLGHGR